MQTGGPPPRVGLRDPVGFCRSDGVRTLLRQGGGFAGSGNPLPAQPISVLWGANDRILSPPQKRAALALLGDRVRELDACGHLPHIDQPQTVATTWLNG